MKTLQATSEKSICLKNSPKGSLSQVFFPLACLKSPPKPSSSSGSIFFLAKTNSTSHFLFSFFFLIPLFVSSSASHYRLSYSPVSEHVVSQPPAWSATSLPVHAARLLCREGVPLTCLGCCQLLVMRRHPSNVIIYIKKKPKSPALERESTNMPLFGRVHKCKEYEH